ncbi:MAG: HTTM domain-containing protein [Phormidesmis sp.]
MLQSIIKEPLKGTFKAWDSYWFHPAPLLNLAICRIIVIGFQLYHLLSNAYGKRILVEGHLPGRVFEPLPVFQMLNWPFPWNAPPSLFLSAVFIAMIASGVSSLCGFKTRLSLFIFAFSNLYIQTYLYSFGRHHHTETLTLMALFLLAIAPSGKALSLDGLSSHLRRTARQKTVQSANEMQRTNPFARWPLLATQWLFALVYLSAGINKVNADGPGLFTAEWMNGYTLQYYLMQDGLRWGSDIGIWLSQFHVFAILSSWFAVLFEVTFWLVLPFPKLVSLFIPLGIALHTGIWMAQRAPFFQYLALYAVFIPWTAVFKAIAHRFRWHPRPIQNPKHPPIQNKPQAKLFYSSQHQLSLHLASLIAYFDWFNQIDYVELETSPHPLPKQHIQQHIKSRQGTISETLYWVKPDHKMTTGNDIKKGFEALRESMGYCPVLWPLKWICAISAIQVLFKRTYAICRVS